ncbi:putative chromatin target of PRMT1 protein [Helianthus annuus]|uniref:Putative RNA-binding (RRM/RBD/RNP motifs) family protein n=1 Tax=Helianthus annuus TaxID=4232 RepID=A0A251SHY9_HELAN|nr:THO complex subunit 4D [Helianthus annuus]KAJ0464377.1 putative chromatin target of PRMT1 protein [Helianthus annuus]KAJ0468868.1 putative chromatin target of PRMT1 protein [Helianthus annuus]KAJ0485945.1 putative chromatin target of PRMT1 protein [Helianthus annuus]KAJ0656498.1 putative chromatin target of PRMT1 protein [Helianthus annuus]KAJ0660113.1 putative chromatin target of PRMT1 protein [Helianthus annuus]
MASLDMSLDDMIKSRRTAVRGRGRGRGGARGGRGQQRSFGGGRPTGPPRRGPLGVSARPSAHTIAKSFRKPKSSPWQRNLLEESLTAAGVPGFDNVAKLNVSNLDIGVTNEDIRELFSEIGELKRYAIHYDKYGRPSGSAEVLFARRSDAFQALKRYNNVQLDGKPMKIEIEGSNTKTPVSARVNVVGGLNGQRTVVMTSRMGRGRGAIAANRAFGNRGGVRNGRGGMTNMRGGIGGGRGRGRGQSGGRGRGRGKKPAVDKSADELDKELENYHAMQS